MADYKPSVPFNVPMFLLKPTYEVVKGVRKKVYPEASKDLMIYGSFKTYGGTERNVNDVYAIEDTANVETWFRPDILADCRMQLTDGKQFEIINEPENINQRNQWLKFKVRRITGGA